jgi:molybdenum cofactor biosynthesis protein B
VSSLEHKALAPISVPCFVLTVSDTRTDANDTGGQAVRELLERAGHSISGHAIVKDEPSQVTAIVRRQLADQATQVIITTGGTGISARDTTYEAVHGTARETARRIRRAVSDDQLHQIGSAAMMSRATAGTVGRKAIFVLPGSPAAVRLAMEKLIVPELGHIVQQLSK